MARFDIIAEILKLHPNAKPGKDFIFEQAAGEGLVLKHWNAVALGPLPAGLLERQKQEAAKAAARAERDAAYAEELPLPVVLEALLDAVEAKPGSVLATLKAKKADLDKRFGA